MTKMMFYIAPTKRRNRSARIRIRRDECSTTVSTYEVILQTMICKALTTACIYKANPRGYRGTRSRMVILNIALQDLAC